MTPAINTAKKAKIAYTIHEYEHDPSSESYGTEAADKLGIPEERVFKTLLVSYGNKDLAVGVVPVSAMLNMKLFAKVIGARKASMADAADIDISAKNFSTIFVSAGRRGLEGDPSLSR